MDIFDLQAVISINLSDFEHGIDQAQKRFKTFSDNIKGISEKVDKAYSGLGDLLSPAVDGFKAVEGVGKKAGSAISTGLKGFAAASTAVAGFGTAAVNSGMQFDATMSKVSAISGATGQDFDALRDKALEMGAKSKFSASEAADALTYMGMAGWKAGDMISGIEGIMNLAAASGEDLATTSDIVTDALTAFGYTAADSTHFADVLAVASSNANTNVGMMGETFKYVAPVAGTLGYSIEDTALAIGLMANSGIKASSAGTSLRAIFNRLATDTGASSKSLGALGILTQKLGVEFYNADGSARDFNKVLLESRDAWKELTVQEQENYAKKIAGEEAGSAWMAMMNASNEDVQKLTASIEECNGASAKMAETMSDNLQGDIDRLGSAFESLQIAISDSLTPTLREFAQFGQKAMAGLLEGFQGGGVAGFMSALSGIVTDGVTMLAAKAPEFVDVSLQFVDSLIQGLLNGSDAMFSAGEQIITQLVDFLWYQFENNYPQFIEAGKGIIEMIFNGFTQAGEVISMYIGEFVPLIAEAFLSYHEALFTVGLDILGAISQGIIENKESLQSMASETIANMVTALRDNAPAIIEGGIALLEALVGAIMENMPLILETGAEIIGQLVAGISTSMPALIAAVGLILPQIAKVIDVVGNIGGAVGGVVKLVSEGITTIMGIGSQLMVGIKALWGLVASNIPLVAIAAIVAGVVWLWQNCEAFRDGVKVILEAVGGFFKSAYEVITGAFSGAVNFFGGVVEGIKGVFDGIGEFLGGLFTAAWELVRGAWDVAVGFFTEIGSGIQAVFEAVTSFLGEVFSAAWSAITAVWDAAVGFFSAIWDGISSAGQAAAEAIGSALKGAWDAITGVWDGAVSFFGGIWDGIKGVFSDVWSHFLDIGSNIVNGLKDGISDGWSGFISWLGGKITAIPNFVMGLLGIHSPSTVFAGIGENMALGLAEGWGDQYSSIKRQIENGMNFGTATVGLNVSGRAGGGAYGNSGGQSSGQFSAGGNFTVNIYNPQKRDAVTEAREWKKTAQRISICYA